MRWLALTVVCLSVASCGSMPSGKSTTKRSKEYFSEKEYGVKASPRVVTKGPIPKGGGRYLVGKPYVVKGKRYFPKEDFSYNKTGIASWYGSAFHGRLTANGEVYDQLHLSAAHPTFPLPSYARVTNLENGSSIIVRVNDRGPYHPGRIIDLSNKTAEMLDLKHSGTGQVRVQYVGRARMDGHDMPYLMASYQKKGERFPNVEPQIATGVMVASAEPMNGADISAATSLAGNTPSASYATPSNVPFQVIGGAAPAPMAVADPATFALLPDYGPVPAERPEFLGSSYASAYAASAPSSAEAPFDAVLGKQPALTEAMIVAHMRRKAAALGN